MSDIVDDLVVASRAEMGCVTVDEAVCRLELPPAPEREHVLTSNNAAN